ncbi:MAG TPA: hypothetical protein VFA99_06790 [Acidobacteriaceae bacterium]|nr:hypothetical protein [Acidobacteriaceae bacterium]
MNPLLSPWQNFYVIVGSAAGALIGLQFVVMALMANMPVMENESQAVSAFSTPSVVNFGVVLALAAVEVMPWRRLMPVSILWAVSGILGIIYTAITARRFQTQSQTQSAYTPVLVDWVYRIILPFLGYSCLGAAALVARSHPTGALFEVAAVILLLLFIGIHDAWDNATFLVFYKRGQVDPHNPT